MMLRYPRRRRGVAAFARWTEIFGDAVLTAAMVYRLTHKALLVDMNGESYRLKETRAQQQGGESQNL